MTRSPRTGEPGMSVKDAATRMRDYKVGSLVIIEEGRPIGIITERDMVYKVVAQNRQGSLLRVDEVMSAPVVTTTAETDLQKAARTMADLHLRRLPVVEGERLVGMLTENDILRLSPSLIEITREWESIALRGSKVAGETTSEGYCEACGAFSDELRELDGDLLCPECVESK
jgi:signal-transduction protein with cAMP-binding, CBS, and nucleotidyltransferase domain